MNDQQYKITIPLTVSFDPNRKENKLHLKFQDTTGIVKRNGEAVGTITGCVGGGVELEHCRDERVFYLKPADIWNAFISVFPEHSDLIFQNKEKELKSK